MYKTVRFYSRRPRIGEGEHLVTKKRTIATGLTLDQAQAHCQDPDTSSSTATAAIKRRIGRGVWDWFDGYTET